MHQTINTAFSKESAYATPANNNGPINTVVIPVGGLGTRMYPYTLATPKNLVPLGAGTLITHAVDEALIAGASKIVIVCSAEQEKLYRNQFSPTPAQWASVASESKAEQALMLAKLFDQGQHIEFVIQDKPKGLGHAILQARNHVEGDKFGIILPDDAILNDKLQPIALKSMVDTYKGGMSLACTKVPDADTNRYGIFEFEQGRGDDALATQRIKGVVEKPKRDAPSNYAIMGRYILTSDIFPILAEERVGAGNEIQLTDAIEVLIESGVQAHAAKYEGTRYDCGVAAEYCIAQNTITSMMQAQARTHKPQNVPFRHNQSQ